MISSEIKTKTTASYNVIPMNQHCFINCICTDKKEKKFYFVIATTPCCLCWLPVLLQPGAVRLRYSMYAIRRRLHFRNNLQPGYSCRPAAWRPTDGAFSHPYLTRTCRVCLEWICWLCFWSCCPEVTVGWIQRGIVWNKSKIFPILLTVQMHLTTAAYLYRPNSVSGLLVC